MGDLPKRLDYRAAIKLLKKHGWELSRGGKHAIKMVKPGHRPITLPMKRGETWGPGLTSAILAQAGLKSPTPEEDR